MTEKKAAGQEESENALLLERQKERRQAMAVVKKILCVGTGVVTTGYIFLLGVLCFLGWRHVNAGGPAAVNDSVIGTGATAVTLTNISWPVSSLGWAGAVAFLGFAICIGAIVVAVAASLSRIACPDS